jgi:hypothetical protein
VNLTAITNGIIRFGFDASDPITDWINEAQTEFVESFNWPFMFGTSSATLTIGSIVVPVPTDFGVARNFFYKSTNSVTAYPVPYRSQLSVEYNDRNLTETGSPRWWVVSANTVSVFPIPDAAYPFQLDYERDTVVLAAGTDVPVIPAKYHYALVRGGAAIGLEADNQEDRAATQYEKFHNIIDQAISRYQQPQTGTFSKVRDVS